MRIKCVVKNVIIFDLIFDTDQKKSKSNFLCGAILDHVKVFLEAKSNLLDHDLFLTYARLLKMRPIHQVSEIRTEAFASNKQEKFRFYGVFRGENTDWLLRKSLRLLRVQFPKEHDVDRSVNSALFYVKDETVLEFCQFYMDEIKLLSSLKTSSFAINSDALDAKFPQNL